MRASSFHSKKDGLAGCATTQLDLFDHSVCDHTVTAGSFCTHHAPKARCMMVNAQRKPTQDWTSYRLAQVNEKSKFLELLFALCELIDEPPQRMGRPRTPLSDRIFASTFKVYSMLSGRRFMTDLREAKQRGQISTLPNFCSISRFLESEELTPVLKRLIIESSLPLRAVEDDFAVDSSGFATGRQAHWVDAKWNKVRAQYGQPESNRINKRDWVKVHIMCGVKSNIVTAVEITHAHAGDSPQFAPLVETTSENFTMQSVCADKAYSSEKNLQLVLVKQAMPYIAFRSNATATNKASGATWKRMYHLFRANEEAFMRNYHRRSNVETTFSMIKAKFGERLRSKTATAQANEVLCKVLCHNLCVLVQAMYEFNVEPTFASEISPDAEVTLY
jgi:transposase